MMRLINDSGWKCRITSSQWWSFLLFCDILYMEMMYIKNVPMDLQNEIKSLFKNMIGLKKRGTNLFFTDIDALKKKMLDEISC